LLLLAAALGGTGDPKRAAASPGTCSLKPEKLMAPASSTQKKILPTTQCGFSARSKSRKTAISHEKIS
jgi:hypothetical protein